MIFECRDRVRGKTHLETQAPPFSSCKDYLKNFGLTTYDPIFNPNYRDLLLAIKDAAVVKDRVPSEMALYNQNIDFYRSQKYSGAQVVPLTVPTKQLSNSRNSPSSTLENIL